MIPIENNKESSSEQELLSLRLDAPSSDISYMNQPIRKALPTPTGWLVAPSRDFCLFFIRDPKSAMVAPNVFTQLWYCAKDGTPTKLKNTRRLDHASAHETWNELLSNNWELFEYKKIIMLLKYFSEQ